MYQAFYQLKDQPFRLTPDPSFICMTAHHQEALAGLVYSVCTRPGLMVLTGEAGTGKTTLLYSLLELLEKRRFITATCTNPIMTREELFDFLMLKLGTDCRSSLKNRQLSALEDTLTRYRADGRPAVLIIDEAQRLPMDLLEEVRLLLNLETSREKLLQIILAGQPELEDLLQQPELRQFKQRVSVHCKLKSLSLSEVKEYIDHRLAQAGLPQQTLFPEAVIQRIHRYSGGIPRLVNTLCDASLQVGFGTRAAVITLPVVEEAATDLNLAHPASYMVSSAAERMSLPTEPAPTNGHAAVDGNGFGEDSRMPMGSYASRQKSAGIFAGLLDRWR
jgi:general secretion pathway protein A